MRPIFATAVLVLALAGQALAHPGHDAEEKAAPPKSWVLKAEVKSEGVLVGRFFFRRKFDSVDQCKALSDSEEGAQGLAALLAHLQAQLKEDAPKLTAEHSCVEHEE